MAAGKSVSGVIPAELHDVAAKLAEDEATTMSALVSAALALYLGLPAPARRTARYVLTAGSPEAKDRLLDGCGRAIAGAGNQVLQGQLAARGRELGLHLDTADDEALAAAAVKAERDTRLGRRDRLRDFAEGSD